MDSYRVSPSSGGAYTVRRTDAVEGAALGAAGLLGNLIGASVRAGAQMNRDRQDRRMAEALAAMEAAGDSGDFGWVLSLAADFERRYPQNPTGAAYAAMALLELERFDEALAAVMRSAQLGLDATEVSTLRGNAYLLKGDLGPAIKEFTTLMTAQHMEIRLSGYLSRARVLVQLGDLDQALQDTNAAIAICPEEYGYFQRADIYLAADQPAKALDDYTRADRLRPNWPELLERRARAYDALGNTEAAERDRASGKALRDQGPTHPSHEVAAVVAQIRAQGGVLTVSTSGDLEVSGVRLAGSAAEDVRRLKPKIVAYLLRQGA